MFSKKNDFTLKFLNDTDSIFHKILILHDAFPNAVYHIVEELGSISILHRFQEK